MCEKTDPLLIPLDKAADRIGIPKKTLWRFVDGQQVPAVRMGGKWYLAIATIENIVKNGVPVARSASETEAAVLETAAPDLNDPRR